MTTIVRVVACLVIAGGIAFIVMGVRGWHRNTAMPRLRAFNAEWEANRPKREAMARRALAERKGAPQRW